MTVSKGFKFRAAKRAVRRISVRTGRQEGSSLIEFGVVVPLLSMLLLGIVYGGITFYDYVTLANAVAIGAKTVASNRAAGKGTSSNSDACTLGENALLNASYNLNQSLITIDAGATQTEVFNTPAGAAGTSTCNALTYSEVVTVAATYPCNLQIPFTKINLCPVLQGAIKSTSGVTNGYTVGTCPSAYCISSIATVRIE
jgi:Flp pilus assembly protein TadG